MTLARDQDQELFAKSAERLVASLAERDPALSVGAEGGTPDPETVAGLWSRLTDELSATALPLAEDVGQGASWLEAGAVCEALGRHLAPVPYGTVMAAARTIEALGESEALLERMASGYRCMLAVPASSWDAAPHLSWCGGQVKGHVGSVLDAVHAEGWLVPVEVDGVTRLAVTTAAQVTPRRGLDLTRSFGDLAFEGPAELLPGDAAPALAKGLAAAAATLAAESIGGAEQCLQATVEYAKIRQQFGREIGGFQAVKHTLADVLRVLEPAKAAAYAALDAITEDRPDQAAAAALAKLTAVEAYALSAGHAIQLHGAIGFTWETGLHRHFKRAVANRVLWGRATDLRQLLGARLLAEVAQAEKAAEKGQAW